jgi:hypothetical protein
MRHAARERSETERRRPQVLTNGTAHAWHRSKIRYQEIASDFGDDQLVKQCQALARVTPDTPAIFILDGTTTHRFQGPRFKQGLQILGQHVYSLAIPIPDHRQTCGAVCIEHYYTDDDLRTQDAAGKRLYPSTEFNPSSGRHKTDARLSVGHKGKLTHSSGVETPPIIDPDVFNERSENVALSKPGIRKVGRK